MATLPKDCPLNEEGTMDESSEVELKVGDKSLRAKSKYLAELITILLAIGFGIISYVQWQHLEDTRTHNRAMSEQSKEQAKESQTINRAMVEALREQTCLISIPEHERKVEYASPYGFCKRMAR